MWCIGPHIRDWHANKHSKFKYLIRFFFPAAKILKEMEAEATVELNPPESKEPAEQAQDKQVSLLLNSLTTKYNGYCHGKHEYK